MDEWMKHYISMKYLKNKHHKDFFLKKQFLIRDHLIIIR